MTFSNEGLEAAFRQNDGVVSIVLLEITLNDFVFRITSDYPGPTFHLGEQYNAFPFRIGLPDDREGQPSEATLEIDNVDQSIIGMLRSLTGPATMRAKIVRASQPDVVELDYPYMQLSGITVDMATITGTFTGDILENEPCPFVRYDTRFIYIFS